MNKTIKDHLKNFIRWLSLSLLAVSGLANLGVWFYIGMAFWYHKSNYLWFAFFWFCVSIPSGVVRVYVQVLDRKIAKEIRKY